MATALSDLFKTAIEISPPVPDLRNLADRKVRLHSLEEEDPVVQVSFTLQVEPAPDSVLIQVIPLPFARAMARLRRNGPDRIPAEGTPEDAGAEQQSTFGEGNDPFKGEPGGLHGGLQHGYAGWTEPGAAGEECDLEKLALLKDIPVTITVVLGRTSLPLGKLFTLGRGGIIDLNYTAGEPVEILINNKPVARGEVVAVNEELAVRITGIQSGLAGNRNAFKGGGDEAATFWSAGDTALLRTPLKTPSNE